jgi:outer membrane protein assembly factor BamA
MPATEMIRYECKITRFVRDRRRYFILAWFFFLSLGSFGQVYRLNIKYIDRTESVADVSLQQTFSSREACIMYVETIPRLLRQKGYATASIDSFMAMQDSAVLKLFTGKKYRLGQLTIASADEPLLALIGYREKSFMMNDFDNERIRALKEKLVKYLENNGYPFAQVRLDSFDVKEDRMGAQLIIQKGPLYKIDSIRIFGDINLSHAFLQRYLNIPNGSIYKKDKLLGVDRQLRQLPYLSILQPSDLSYLGTGALLNVYLKGRKNSQVNGLIGFLPAAESTGATRLLITGDFNLQLKNSFGKGESLQLMFQQIQIQSPRLKASYQQPFLFGSPFGMDLMFEGFKKDSSFLNIRYQLGMDYAFGGNRSGKLFFQQFITNTDYIDTLQVIRTRRLPEQIDQTTTSLGGDYEWWNTDYRFNPRKGFDIKIQAMAGVRNIRTNNKITTLKGSGNTAFDYASLYDSVQLRAYTFRLKGQAAYYIKTGRQTTLKTSLSGAWIQSPTLFRNELFQIGGFQLLRGFDDESIFASAYMVMTAEYRLLTGQNSYLYTFWDGSWVRNQSQLSNSTSGFWGTGLGATLDTKAGIFNVAFAVGKREELPINLRQMKIHFGYLNFF